VSERDFKLICSQQRGEVLSRHQGSMATAKGMELPGTLRGGGANQFAIFRFGRKSSKGKADGILFVQGGGVRRISALQTKEIEREYESNANSWDGLRRKR